MSDLMDEIFEVLRAVGQLLVIGVGLACTLFVVASLAGCDPVGAERERIAQCVERGGDIVYDRGGLLQQCVVRAK